MAEDKRSHRRGYWLLVGTVLLAAILGGLFLRKYAVREPLPQQLPSQVSPEQGLKTVSLFFAAPDGGGLLREAREIGPCSGVVECAEEVLGELINGPLGDLSPTLPETVMFHNVTLSGETLTVDFGREFQADLPAGSNSEMAAVFSVVNSMAVNFTQVKYVRFLVDGKTIETLKGHLDLREPLAPDYTLEKRDYSPDVAPTPQRRQP